MTDKPSRKSHLTRAGTVKNDEFYTQLVDIENEMKHYKSQFFGKVVYCNCDDPYESNFVRYFALNFNELELKRIIVTSYNPSGIASKLIVNKVDGLDGDSTLDVREIVEQLKANKNNEWTPIEGDGDFRSDECINLLKQSDIVVTNPPFSLFRQYISQLMEHDKKFLILGNLNAICYKSIFKVIKENKLWLGYDNGHKKYRVPNTFENKTMVVIDEKKYMPMGNTGWFTNLDKTKQLEKLTLHKRYSPEEYPKYDNYNAIEVSKVSDIPLDYKGLMGVPVTFLTKYNPDQFEILGMCESLDLYNLKTKRYSSAECKQAYLDKFGEKGVSSLNSSGILMVNKELKLTYKRLLIKSKET